MSNTLTDKELDKIVDNIAKERENSEAIDMEDIKKEVEVDIDAKLESEVKEGQINNASDLLTAKVEAVPTVNNISLFDLDGDQIKESNPDNSNIDNINEEHVSGMAKEIFELNDEEILSMLSVIDNLKKNPKAAIYKDLPESIKKTIRDLASQNNIPVTQYNNIARVIMNELINDNEYNSAIIDLEKALNEALNIPSVIDIYSDHISTVMNKNIPKMAEEIREIDPAKADLLLSVKTRFESSYSFEFAKQTYEDMSIVRKAVRRQDIEIKRSVDAFNVSNERSNFKFNDATEIPKVLYDILIDQPNEYDPESGIEETEVSRRCKSMNITKTDIDKFTVLITKSCMNLNSKDILDATYMYYLVKNIVMLAFTNEAKTEFSVELINNICDTIEFIRNKEAEFNCLKKSTQTPRRKGASNN